MSLKEIIESLDNAYQHQDRKLMYTLGFVNGISVLAAIGSAIQGRYIESAFFGACIPITHHALYLGDRIRQKRKGDTKDADVRI